MEKLAILFISASARSVINSNLSVYCYVSVVESTIRLIYRAEIYGLLHILRLSLKVLLLSRDGCYPQSF